MRVAEIHRLPDGGRYHFHPVGPDLAPVGPDLASAGYHTKIGAIGAAKSAGYTHVSGPGSLWAGVHAIPPGYEWTGRELEETFRHSFEVETIRRAELADTDAGGAK